MEYDEWWLLKQSITPQAFALHGALVAFARAEHWPSLDDLAALLNLQRRAVRPYLRELTTIGVVDFALSDESAHRGYAYTVRSYPDGPALIIAPPEHAEPLKALSPLDAARRDFLKSPGRKALRAAIAAGVVVCVKCGTSDDLQVDHKIALARHGTNDEDNMQVLCGRCNRIKGVR